MAIGASIRETASHLPPDPLGSRNLVDIARGLRNGFLTSQALTEVYLERIAKLDPRIGAFRAVDSAVALKQASRTDDLFRQGVDLGPLMGLPVAIKEIFRVTDFPFGAGTQIDISNLIPSEGPFVSCLKQQGVVVLGVTKTTEFAAATINSRNAMPWNPWDSTTQRVCGGSSHGSASALAAGMCTFAIGSDSGGSVRLPAALCGLVGVKPSMGVWSGEGVFPLTPTFDTVGTFTHSVDDAILCFEQLSGQSVPDPLKASSLRFGRIVNLLAGVDASVCAAMDRALARLTKAGVQFVDLDLPEAEEVSTVFGRILAGELVLYLGRDRLLAEREKIDPVPWSRIESEIDIDEIILKALRERHRELIATVNKKTEGIDALLCSTAPFSPSPISQVSTDADAIEWNRLAGRNTRPANLFGQCGISLPIHELGELPVGLQLLGRSGGDSKLLACAASVESILGRGPKPDLSSFIRHA